MRRNGQNDLLGKSGSGVPLAQRPLEVMSLREDLPISPTPVRRGCSASVSVEGSSPPPAPRITATLSMTQRLTVNLTMERSLASDFWNPRSAQNRSSASSYVWPEPLNPSARNAGLWRLQHLFERLLSGRGSHALTEPSGAVSRWT
jgi:hypothetical protein